MYVVYPLKKCFLALALRAASQLCLEVSPRDKYCMQQYTQSSQVMARKPTVKTDTNLVEARLIDLVNRLSEQNALQARQIRRLESDITLFKESLNAMIK